jgi:ubiquinone/menaquinone biosynthesis C-methylase UbiE
VLGKLVIAAGGALAGALWWWRKNPSACPYGQRVFVDVPHPFITRQRLGEALRPQTGERVLEIGPGTGYYTLDLADWVGPEGRVDIVDLQQEFLDHTMRRAHEHEAGNVHPTRADAQALPFDDGTFDTCVLVTVLGEIPDQDAGLREIARVLRPGGRLVVGELALDPHYVTPAALERRAAAAGLRMEERLGPAVGYFARLVA